MYCMVGSFKYITTLLTVYFWLKTNKQNPSAVKFHQDMNMTQLIRHEVNSRISK